MSERRDRINLRIPMGDHTLSFARRPRGGRVVVSLEPDSPMTYGYEEAGTVLDEFQLRRLAYWILTGVALDRDEPIPEMAAAER